VALPDDIYRAAFEQPMTPLAVVDERGLLAIWNAPFETIFRVLAGAGPERLRDPFFEFIAGRGGRQLDYFASELLLGSRSSAHMECGIGAADGTRRWMRFTLSRMDAPATPHSDRLERFILCALEDVTDRVTREAKLTEAKEEAEKATQTKSLFLANMSHEIRTPIQTILGVVELLRETSLDTEQSEYVNQVMFSADVLLALINDILDFSKIEAGKLELETAEFDLRATVHRSVDLLVMDAHRKGLEVIVDIDETLPTLVRGDPARLRQILVNLIKNAVKFTPEGCISLVLKRARTAKGPVLRFEVQDTGIGIPADVRARLFTAFYQGDVAAARRAGGTGLGLAISRSLVDLMGGSIGVVPNEPHGSIFWFEIPLSSPDYSGPPHPRVVAGRPRVLVVDDHPAARALAARTAQAAGYVVQEAGSGEEALAALGAAARAGGPFDLCLVDQNMPHMDGWRLASEITGDIAINSVRLILMVPRGTMGRDAKMKLLRWFNAYVAKPLRPSELLDTLARAVLANVDLEEAEPADVEPLGEEEEPDRSFSGRILLAEDHEVNRELFTILISRLGCSVTPARDGLEAVELGDAALREGRPYDLVLMDVFMPRMNGYEATEALRQKGYRGPIIAVTASALKGERDKCIAVGMDDILTKPFKKEDLSRLLASWMPAEPNRGRARAAGNADIPEAQAGATAFPANAGVTAAAETPDPAVFDWDGVLDTFLGQRETVVSLLGRFTEKASAQLRELEDALADGDYSRFRETAHSLKGASWNLSARGLGDAALSAETAGRDADADAAAKAVVRVSQALEMFIRASAPYVG
jgi:PAS domain S-box-containing protein